MKSIMKIVAIVLILTLCAAMLCACNPGAYLAPLGISSSGNAGFYASSGNAIYYPSSGNMIVPSAGNVVPSAGNAG